MELPLSDSFLWLIIKNASGRSDELFPFLLVAKANAVCVEVSTNPSPSGDGWFDDPDNMASVMRGIEDAKQGRTKAYTIDEMRKMLDI